MAGREAALDQPFKDRFQGAPVSGCVSPAATEPPAVLVQCRGCPRGICGSERQRLSLSNP